MPTLFQDLRYGWRTWRKSPGLAAVALLTLALGIGANTAIFSVVNGVLLRPLPYPEPESLVMIWEDPGDIPRNSVNPRNYADWREQNEAFSQVAAITPQSVNLTGEGEPERIVSARVAASFFSILQVNPAIGRGFLPTEDQPESQRVAVLSDSLWQRRFGADPNVIGRSLTLNGATTTVVGVMPPSFRFPLQADLWLPLVFTPREMLDTNRGSHYLSVVGRLKPGVSVEQAQAQMDTIYDRLREQFPRALAKWKVRVVSLSDDTVGAIRPALLILLGAVCFVLLIACANVASLMLARATARQREMAIRTALGASRGRLARQLLTESVMLALAGGALGILFGLWGIDLLIYLSPANLPRLDEIRVDRSVLLFTLLLSLLSGVIFGVVPALQSSRVNLNESLKESSGRGSIGGRQSYLRQVFIVGEVALSLVLLLGAGLMVKSFIRLGQVEPGFNPENVLSVRISLPQSRYSEPQPQIAFYRQVVERVQALAGVQSTALISDPPISGSIGLWQNGFEIEGQPTSAPGEGRYAYLRWTTPDYFQTMSIPLVRGGLLTESDIGSKPWVAVIDEAMARRFFPDEDPIGKRISVSIRDNAPREIVGIVGNVKQTSLDSEAGPHMYIAYYQTPLSYATLLVRAPGDPNVLTAAVKQEVLAADPGQPIHSASTLAQIISNSIADQRFNLTMLGLFAAVALLLAVVGVYGVISYSVTQRTQEIGLRIALGATNREVMKLIVGQGLKLTLVGVGLGLACAFALTRMMSSLLFGVSATDPPTFIITAMLLTLTAVAACYIPARRAARVDPMVALKYE